MTILARLRANPSVRKHLLVHLITHEVEDRNREWFARCQINHCSAFPLAKYDTLRFAFVAAVAASFAGFLACLMVLAAGASVVAAQMRFDALHRGQARSHSSQLRLLRAIGVYRSCTWAATTAATIVFAPPDLRTPLFVLVTLAVTFDAQGLLVMPRTAIACAAIQAGALAAAALATGGSAGVLTAVIAASSVLYLHWAIFNLYYMFATRRLRTRDLTEKNETIRLLLNQYDEEGSDWLYECDVHGRIHDPSKRFCKAAGLPPEKLAGCRMSDFITDPQRRDEFRERAHSSQLLRNEVIPVDFGGGTRWWSISGRPLFDASGTKIGRRGFIADVTASHVADQRVAYMAHYDSLTGLPNRSLFGTTVERAFARRADDRLIALLYVDLDHFKAVNDTYGHNVGDEVLTTAAQRIERVVPEGAMVARLGGDEFAVLIDRLADRADALKVAEAIVTAMDDPVLVDGQIMPIGASVGIAFAPDSGIDGEMVLQAADLALYNAKSKGRHGASLFDPAMQQQARERRMLELDLRAALKRDEFEVHYQPLVNVRSNEIEGYEALLRWNHPTRGSVSPTVFIPIAEETGQIVEIGSWVLREALMEAATWPEHLSVSVNLSPAQMRDEAMITKIIGALARSGLAPERLEIEITETTLMTDSAENLALLHKLHSLGIKIALDDFGTGYSSLNYLRSFPFDKIKIDRCFVTDIAERKDNQAIVAAVIELANQLKIRTTAEGVETEGQLSRLRGTGCDLVQGFLFSQALPPAELEHARSRDVPAGDAVEPVPIRRRAAAAKVRPARGRKAG